MALSNNYVYLGAIISTKMNNPFQKASQWIDAENAQDPTTEIDQNIAYPKELLYSKRMYEKLMDFLPEASDEVQLAAKAQHICRWKVVLNRTQWIEWAT